MTAILTSSRRRRSTSPPVDAVTAATGVSARSSGSSRRPSRRRRSSSARLEIGLSLIQPAPRSTDGALVRRNRPPRRAPISSVRVAQQGRSNVHHDVSGVRPPIHPDARQPEGHPRKGGRARGGEEDRRVGVAQRAPLPRHVSLHRPGADRDAIRPRDQRPACGGRAAPVEDKEASFANWWRGSTSRSPTWQRCRPPSSTARRAARSSGRSAAMGRNYDGLVDLFQFALPNFYFHRHRVRDPAPQRHRDRQG